MNYANQISGQALAPLDIPGTKQHGMACSLSWKRWLSRPVLSRISVLFLVLCLIKAMMLVSFRKQLFEIHWRVMPIHPVTLAGQIAFYLFSVLLGLNLWMLAKQCKVAGTRVVRWANACLLVLCAAFIFLTFHEGDKNYLYPTLGGVLHWSDLRWYLYLNFFFRPPFLAGWFLGYALIYYGMARARREHLMLYVTAICAAAYTALFLGDFKQYFDAIVILDLLGIACLLAGWRAKRPLSVTGICLPLVWTAFMFLLFHGMAAGLSFTQINPEFAVLVCLSLMLFVAAITLASRRGFFRGWSWLTPFALLSFLLLINVNYPPASNYRSLICVGLTLPRYFLGEFGISLVLLGMALGYRRWRPGGSLLWLDLVSFVFVAWALADLRLSQVMGVRLDWSAWSLAMGETPKMMWRMSRQYLPAIAAVLTCLIGFYAVLMVLGRRTKRSEPSSAGFVLTPGLRFILVTFVLWGLAGEWLIDRDKAEGQSALLLVETSPLWKHAEIPPLDKSDFIKTAEALGMGQLLAPQKPRVAEGTPRNLNVVLIFQESTYNKFLSLFDGTNDTQPLLSKYKDRMEIFPDFFSDFAGSMNARFATFTGIYPVRDYKKFTEQRVDAKSIFEVLHDHGYHCSLFYSSFLDYTDFRDYLRGRGLDEIYDADTMPGPPKLKPVSWGLPEEETLGAIQTQIKKYAAQKQKFFLTYVPAAPHNPFDGTPKRFIKFPPEKMGDYTPAYLNELRYMDWVVSSVVDQLKESGLLDHTLVVITDDHGEMLGENGGPIGHGWALTPELANIPLIIMNPNRHGYRVNDTIGSQVDLLPTMLSILHIPLPQNQLYQGTSLYSCGDRTNRIIYLNTFQQYAFVKGNQMFFGDRETASQPAEGNVDKIYTITNDGSHTGFAQEPISDVPDFPVIADFDKFQENFLRNYTHYCQLMWP